MGLVEVGVGEMVWVEEEAGGGGVGIDLVCYLTLYVTLDSLGMYLGPWDDWI